MPRAGRGRRSPSRAAASCRSTCARRAHCRPAPQLNIASVIAAAARGDLPPRTSPQSLPLPTSPTSSRCIGCRDAMSRAISSIASVTWPRSARTGSAARIARRTAAQPSVHARCRTGARLRANSVNPSLDVCKSSNAMWVRPRAVGRAARIGEGVFRRARPRPRVNRAAYLAGDRRKIETARASPPSSASGTHVAVAVDRAGDDLAPDARAHRGDR